MVLTTDVAGRVLQMLNIEDTEISADANLLEFGLNSLVLMQLVDLFRAKYCKTLEYTDFVMAPSIGEWTALLNHALEEQTLANTVPESAFVSGGDENTKLSLVENISVESALVEMSLAEMQYAYWSGRQADKVAAHLYVEFDGKNIEVPRLQKAIDEVFAHHPMLRVQVSDQGRQRIGSFKPGAGLTIDDCAQRQAGDVEQFLAQKRKRMTHQLLAIATGQVVDFSLTLLPDARHRLHVDIDMVAIDPHSFLILLEDLARAYLDAMPGTPESSVDFFNYLELQAQDSERELKAETDKEWWSKKLLAMPASPTIPLIPHGLRDAVSSTSLSCHLGRSESRLLAAIAQQHNCSLTAVVLGVFCVVLARWSKEPRFRLNFPLFKRTPYLVNTDSIIGDFTTFLLLDINLENSQALSAIFQAVDSEIAQTSAHSTYAGVSLLRDMTRNSHANEIAPIVFTSGLDVGELFSSSVLKSLGHPVWCVSQGPKVDLDVQVALCNEQLFINWDVRLDAFKGNVANDMFTAYITALKQLAENPQVLTNSGYELLQPSSLPVVVKQQEQSVSTAGLQVKINTSLQSSPERVAIIQGKQVTSYRQLELLQQNILGNLQHNGVGIESKILLVVDNPQAASVLVTLLAAGICFIPVASQLLTGLAQEKFNQWLDESGCDYVIAGTVLPVSKILLSFDDLVAPCNPQPKQQDWQTLASGQPGAVAFFSATVSDDGHISVVPVLRSQLEQNIDNVLSAANLTSEHVCLSLSHLTTVVSVAEFVSALVTHATLVLVDSLEDSSADTTPKQWRDTIQTNLVTHLFATTAQVSVLLRQARVGELATLTHCVVAGEEITLAVIQHLQSLQCTAQLLLHVNWGNGVPAAIFSGAIAAQTCGKLSYIAYQPASAFNYQIMDKRGQVCPEWVEGELCISSGYSSTVIDAATVVDAQGNNWLRTGKIASYNNSSEIIFSATGSIQPSRLVDRQGYQLSLTELQNIIATTDGVYNAVLIPRHENAGQHFALAVVADDALIDAAHIKRELSARLPGHFIPEPIFLIDELPLDHNGQVNTREIQNHYHNALENYQALENSAAQQASALERTVTYICAQIIGMPGNELDATDDFFELGGDSLLATHLTAHLNQYFQGANLTVVDVFSLRTPETLAGLIDDNLPATANRIAEVFLTVIEAE